jgi:two-component system, response regulator
MAEDDEDDRELAQDAMHEAWNGERLRFVSDGRDLMDYLRREGRYADPAADAPRPEIILLDLNMPKKDGREALAEIKADEALRQIPVIVLSTSHDPSDIGHAYDLGVNSFITKPVTFPGLVEVLRVWTHYWLGIVSLPEEASG